MQYVAVKLLGQGQIGEQWGCRFRKANGVCTAQLLLYLYVCFIINNFFGFCFQLPHVFVNCVECFTLRLLLEQILNRLSHLSSSEDGYCTEITCDTFNDFVRLFKQVTKAESLKDQTVYIVSNLIMYHLLFENSLLSRSIPYISFATIMYGAL